MEKLTPMEAVRAICRGCLGTKALTEDLIKNCEGDHVSCVLFPYRLGKRISVKAIRKYCLQSCMNGYRESVETCTTKNCPAWSYRFGHNEAYKGRVHDTSKGTAALKAWRESKNRVAESA